MKDQMLGVKIQNYSGKNILEKIDNSVRKHEKFIHVVSLNPEILVIAHKNREFMRVLNDAEIKITDGVGVILAGRVLGVKTGEKMSGVDLMERLISHNFGLSLRVALIGGSGNLAESIALRYSHAHPEAIFFGTEGFKNVKNPTKDEENRLKTEIADLRPHLVFVSFGSPEQEIWIEKHREMFKNSVVMGVGGAFDFIGGRVKRAPVWMRKMGIEWFFRLLIQPWRWRRQLRLFSFVFLVFREKVWKKA